VAVRQLQLGCASQPKLSVPGDAIDFDCLRELFSRCLDQRGSRLGELVREVVSDAVTVGDDARTDHGIGCVGPGNLHHAEVDFLGDDESPTFEPHLAVIGSAFGFGVVAEAKEI
jgi:hypothetical protein